MLLCDTPRAQDRSDCERLPMCTFVPRRSCLHPDCARLDNDLPTCVRLGCVDTEAAAVPSAAASPAAASPASLAASGGTPTMTPSVAPQGPSTTTEATRETSEAVLSPTVLAIIIAVGSFLCLVCSCVSILVACVVLRRRRAAAALASSRPNRLRGRSSRTTSVGRFSESEFHTSDRYRAGAKRLSIQHHVEFSSRTPQQHNPLYGRHGR